MLCRWILFPLASSVMGLAACGGEFSSNAEPGAVGSSGNNGGGAGGTVETTTGGSGSANNGVGGSPNGSAGSMPNVAGSGIGGAGGSIVPGTGGGGIGGAGLGGGSVVDASVPPIIDAGGPDRVVTFDVVTDAITTTTPDASDASVALCTPGTLQCDAVPSRRCQDDKQWHNYHCGPMMLSDVTGLDVTKFVGFNTVPGLDGGSNFRCKTITVCGVAQNCIYYGEMLGSLESGEAMFYDGVAIGAGAAVKISLAGGAASQCLNPSVTIQSGESILVTSGTQTKRIFLPAFVGTDFVFYVREDGATFKDAGLTMMLQGPG